MGISQMFSATAMAPFLDSLLSAMSEAAMVLDTEGHMIAINQAAARCWLPADLGELSPTHLTEVDEHLCSQIPFAAFSPNREPLLGNEHPFFRAASGSPTTQKILVENIQGHTTPLMAKFIPIQSPTETSPSAVLCLMTAISSGSTQIDTQSPALKEQFRLSVIGSLSAGLGHEINNPLAAIMLRLEILKDHFQAKTGPDADFLNTQISSLFGNCDRIAAILRSLRAVSRPELQDPIGLYHLKTIISDVTIILGERTIKQGIELTTDVPDNLIVECQRSALSQALIYLVQNASEAVHGSKDSWIKIVATESSHAICISITDSGLGVSEEVLEDMMNPLVTTKKDRLRLGLGLAAAHEIACSLGGTITYDTQSGYTRFSLRLPTSILTEVAS